MPKARPARSRWLLLPALGWHSVESGWNRKFPEGSGSQHSAQALHQLSSGLGPFFGWRCPPPPCKLGTGFLCSRELSRASLLQDSLTWIFNSSAGDQFPLFSDEGKLEMGDPGGCPCSPHPLQVSGQLPRVSCSGGLVAQLCLTLFVTPWTVTCQTPLSEISQARLLEWVAIPFSRGSSQLRDGTQVSCLAGGFFTN